MELDKILHLRALTPNHIDKNQSFTPTNYDATLRGVTVAGVFVWNQEEDRQDIVFSWAIQNPRDTYVKKEGVRIAEDRMQTGLIIQTNYDYQFPLKYQFFNAIANAHEYFKDQVMREDFIDLRNSVELYEKFRLVELTFESLADIAERNHWFTDVGTKQLPSIHPDILVNYIHRMKRQQETLDFIYDVLAERPYLVDSLNMFNGVKV